MKPAPFELVVAESRRHALELLAEHGDECKVLAGGQSLGPLLNLRLATPALIVDVNRLDELDSIERDPQGGLVIGAMTRHRRVERAIEATRPWALLADALPLVGHIAIRNRGTVGGSLAHADPAAELPAIAVAVGAVAHVEAASGARTIAAADLFESYYSTSLDPTELLTAVELPAPAPRTGSCWLEFAPRHGDYGYVGVAAVVTLDGDGRCADAHLVFSGVASTPHVAGCAADLVGRRPDGADLEELASCAGAEIDPLDDAAAPSCYKQRLMRALAAAASATAVERAGAGS